MAGKEFFSHFRIFARSHWLSLFIVVMNGLENLLRQDREGCVLKLLIVHVTGDDLVVVGHALNHEVFDKLADTKLELVEKIGPPFG